MRAVVFHKPGDMLTVEDRQTPVAGLGDIVLKVAYCGICGSDLHATEPSPTSLESGTVLGHEYAGIVTESGSNDFRPGDRAIGLPLQECDDCRPSGQGCKDRLGIHCPRNKIIGLSAAVPGGYAEYLRMPAHHALKVPDGLDLRLAALTEPLAVGLHAVRAAGNLLGQRVLVIGAGPIGLAVALFARLNGAKEVKLYRVEEVVLARFRDASIESSAMQYSIARASSSEDSSRARRIASRVSSTASGLRRAIRSAVAVAPCSPATPIARNLRTTSMAVGAAKQSSIHSRRDASSPPVPLPAAEFVAVATSARTAWSSGASRTKSRSSTA